MTTSLAGGQKAAEATAGAGGARAAAAPAGRLVVP